MSSYTVKITNVEERINEMNAQQKHALAEFVIESAKAIGNGDYVGTWPLWKEMAEEAEASGVILPMTKTIHAHAEGKKGEMSNQEGDTTMNIIVNSKTYDGYRWENGTHCRYVEEKNFVQYTPVKEEDGTWVKTVYHDGTVEWADRRETKVDINKLFRIADAAKNVGDYEVANACFAVIGFAAIAAKQFGSQFSDCEAARVAFLYEYDDHDDIIGALAAPDGKGYYDLPAVSFSGPTLMGGASEAHYLCIPLPLVSGWFTNHMIRLISKDTPKGTCWIPRRRHSRKFWRMSSERREAARRDLARRLLEEVGEVLPAVCNLVLRCTCEPGYSPEPTPESEDYGVTKAVIRLRCGFDSHTCP